MRSTICVDCRKQFSVDTKTGLTPSRCEPCRKVQKRETDRAKTARWRAADPERQRRYDREYQARRRLEPEFRQRRSDFELIRKYGVTRADYDALLAAQDGKCAICRGGHKGPGNRLHVDHCHDSSRIRGLLCGKCNTAVGLLDNDPARADALAAYLRR